LTLAPKSVLITLNYKDMLIPCPKLETKTKNKKIGSYLFLTKKRL